MEKAKDLLMEIFNAGLRAVDPEAAVRSQVSRQGNCLTVGGRAYDLDDFRRVILIGAGKATALMAKALEELLEDCLTEGLILVKPGYAVPLRKTRVIEAGHPIPDQSGLEGTEEIIRRLSAASEKDLVVCAFSGGASALLPAPVPPLNLSQKQLTTQLLLECGAEIGEINSIRKHLSRSKGGGLARAAYPATLISLILSDVVGDRLDVIASGPTVPDASRFADCIAMVERYGLASRLPGPVWQYLKDGAAGLWPETPKAGDPIFDKVQNVVVGNNRMALLAARDQAEALGFRALLLTSGLEGEAQQVGRMLVGAGKRSRFFRSPGGSACLSARRRGDYRHPAGPGERRPQPGTGVGGGHGPGGIKPDQPAQCRHRWHGRPHRCGRGLRRWRHLPEGPGPGPRSWGLSVPP